MHACIDCNARAEANGPAEMAGRTPAAARTAAATTVARRALAIAPGGLSAWLLRARGGGDGDEAGRQAGMARRAMGCASDAPDKGERSERDELTVSEAAQRGEERRREESRRQAQIGGGRAGVGKSASGWTWMALGHAFHPPPNHSIYYTNNVNI